jgi:aerobic carbon-monoxide dehydrogenase small subunit
MIGSCAVAASSPPTSDCREGLDNDPVMAALRPAFTAEHALQCGYCTPGVLITRTTSSCGYQRRMSRASGSSSAGNLCRCTGYLGIVRAIQRVIAARRAR